jgi:pimeloyl-ACP methyl ester carboxylesterase
MTDRDTTSGGATQYVAASEGRIAYDVAGAGPLVILVPGVAEPRSSYRFVAPELRSAGYRVACSGLRGHGESDTTFGSYGDAETAADILALVAHLGTPAVVVGNSLAGGAGVIAAAERPDLVRALVLLDPFVRNPPPTEGGDADLPQVDADFWAGYAPSLYAGRRPSDFDDYLAEMVAGLRRPGYAEAFVSTLFADHAPAEARLGEVTAPTLVVMGEQDPDFADPRAEADWVAAATGGTVVMIPEAGHYPQSQQPELTTSAILRFLATLPE